LGIVRRLGFYLSGFVIGLILLFFFLGGKRASCDYGPTARTLKNIRSKERLFSDEVLQTLAKNMLDTSVVSQLLMDGDVLFSESQTHLDSCNVYVIEGVSSNMELKISVKNCETKAYFEGLVIKE